MEITIIDDLENKVASLTQAQMAEEYEEASKIQAQIATLCQQLESIPVEELRAYQDRLQAIYSKLATGLEFAEQAHQEIREELLGYKKKAAGINAYRQNAGRMKRW